MSTQVRAPVEKTPVAFFAHAAPLFAEEGDLRLH